MERLSSDLLIGRHDDPHLAFVVLVYPDQAPTLISLTGRGSGAHDLRQLNFKEPTKEEASEGRREQIFSWNDFEEASHAMSDAEFAMRIAQWREPKQKFGDFLSEQIEKGWARRREAPIRAELRKAQYEAEFPYVCGCGPRRFRTERGLRQHQERSTICSVAQGEPLLDDESPRPRGD